MDGDLYFDKFLDTDECEDLFDAFQQALHQAYRAGYRQCVETDTSCVAND